jgi:uncharacterized MAPEG superfamily protein
LAESERSLSLLGGAAGVASAILLWRGLLAAIPPNPAATSLAIRIGIALTGLLPSAGVLLAMTAVQMAARFAAEKFDPMAGRDGFFLLRNQRVITNTVEQFSIFAPALLAFAAAAPSAWAGQITALAGTFAAARVVFWIGYIAGPLGRGPGMAATVTVNFATFAAAVWLSLRSA